MFGWFRRRWVSREEHEAMILTYEDQLARMEKLVETSMEAATQALQRSNAHISLIENFSGKITPNGPTKH